MNCAHCDRWVDMSNNPPSSAVWCRLECRDAWFAARPEEAAKWTDVRDLSAVQRAELIGLLGGGGKA